MECACHLTNELRHIQVGETKESLEHHPGKLILQQHYVIHDASLVGVETREQRLRQALRKGAMQHVLQQEATIMEHHNLKGIVADTLYRIVDVVAAGSVCDGVDRLIHLIERAIG